MKKIGKLTKEIFLERAFNIHGNKYDYSLVEFKTSKDKVKILCCKHGIFEQCVSCHVNVGQGCVKCYNETVSSRCRKTKERFMEQANIIHKNYFNYEKFEYLRAHDKSTIICPSHGEFQQSANQHLKGEKCPKCSKEQSDNWGWSRAKWLEIAKTKTPKIYVVKVFNENEEFIKVGITTKPKAKYRLVQMPYDYEILLELESEGINIWNLENEIKREFRKENKYIPKIQFKGMYECYNYLIKDKLIEKCRKKLSELQVGLRVKTHLE